MSEGIDLPLLDSPRATPETLLSTTKRHARLLQATPQILAACEGETDAVALQATLSCLLFQTLAQANFCGFYRRVGEHTLAVGPYQGSMGCLRIDFARGVCGKCARTKEVQLIPDVHAVPDHIACDGRSRSELVVPVLRAGQLFAVFDVDSPYPDAFSEEEARAVESLIRAVFDRPDVRF
jgi:GAF domain-containing protein